MFYKNGGAATKTKDKKDDKRGIEYCLNGIFNVQFSSL